MADGAPNSRCPSTHSDHATTTSQLRRLPQPYFVSKIKYGSKPPDRHLQTILTLSVLASHTPINQLIPAYPQMDGEVMSIQQLANNEGASSVLMIPEVLEHVLLSLSVRDLYVTQRVSRRWKAVINSSIRIRRSMFLAPSNDSVSLNSTSTWARSRSLLNPFVQTVLSSIGDFLVENARYDATTRQFRLELANYDPLNDGSRNVHKFTNDSNASWRKMRISEHKIQIRDWWYLDECGVKTLDNPQLYGDHSTLGQLLDVAEQQRRNFSELYSHLQKDDRVEQQGVVAKSLDREEAAKKEGTEGRGKW